MQASSVGATDHTTQPRRVEGYAIQIRASALGDVHATMKSPSDALLRMHSHC